MEDSLINSFYQKKVGPVSKTERIISYDALSKPPEEIPLVNPEVEMTVHVVTYALAGLQSTRRKGRVGEEEKGILALAKQAIEQVRGLNDKKDRKRLLDTLVQLNIKTEGLEEA